MTCEGCGTPLTKKPYVPPPGKSPWYRCGYCGVAP